MRWLAVAARRAAFAMARMARGRRGDGTRGQLLNERRRGAGVVLIWALDRAPDAPDLRRALERLDGVQTRVLIMTSLDIRGAGQGGAMIEVFADAKIRDRHANRDWARYLARRMARIRESWDADLEVVVGIRPEDFIAALERPGGPSPHRPDPGITDAPAS